MVKLRALVLSKTKQLIELELAKIQNYVSDPLLQNAVNYAIFPGKRLRGTLLLACLKNHIAKISPQAVAAAAAVEVTHAFSLIHDDMPALDNSELRRGKPSFFKKYGEANALLIGDLLQYLAQYHLRNHPKLLTLLVSYAKDMVLGQLQECNSPAKTLAELQAIQDLKTGRLFELCGAMAASIANLNPTEEQSLLAGCLALGQNLQWVDDISDIDEDAPGTNILHFISRKELQIKIAKNKEKAKEINWSGADCPNDNF